MSLSERWLFTAAGRPFPEDGAAAAWAARDAEGEGGALYDQLFTVLRAEAETMLRSGVAMRPADWLLLSRVEREAFAAAATRLAIDQAVTFGEAASSPRAAAALQAPIDGGEAHDDMVFDECFEELVGALRKRCGHGG